MTMDIKLLTQSNRLTACFLNSEKVNDDEYKKCLADIDAKITQDHDSFKKRLQESSDNWGKVKLGFISAAVFFAAATIVAVAVFTFPNPLVTLICIDLFAMIVGSYFGALTAPVQASNQVPKKLFDDQHTLFRVNNKPYDTHLKVKEYSFDKYCKILTRS